MLKLPFVLLYTAMTAIFWGIYGVLLHRAQETMSHSSLRAFVGVGIAYFLIAVMVPIGLMSAKKETGYWSISGTILSLLAGAVGALGALGVILALSFHGLPIYVMPIVFGGAPVINTLVTAWLNKSFNQINPKFITGMVLVAVGMVGVLLNKPYPPIKELAEAPEVNVVAVASAIVMAFVCWGAYGPVLHLGQMRMGGSRLRPFCCVGISYFVIAVAAPLILLSMSTDEGSFTTVGIFWSILAGGAGAVGALGIIMAFTYGGKPVFVMPLVFGFAPVINTLTSMSVAGSLSKISQYFVASLLIGIAGAVTVLIFAPKAKPHAPAPDSTPKGPGNPLQTNAAQAASSTTTAR